MFQMQTEKTIYYFLEIKKTEIKKYKTCRHCLLYKQWEYSSKKEKNVPLKRTVTSVRTVEDSACDNSYIDINLITGHNDNYAPLPPDSIIMSNEKLSVKLENQNEEDNLLDDISSNNLILSSNIDYIDNSNIETYIDDTFSDKDWCLDNIYENHILQYMDY